MLSQDFFFFGCRIKLPQYIFKVHLHVTFLNTGGYQGSYCREFCAKPVQATICINSEALGLPNSSIEQDAIGCIPVNPPTVPNAKGMVMLNRKMPSCKVQELRLWYRPERAAYVCPHASIALKSLPVAKTAASIPLKIPLLCVVALVGSTVAIRTALKNDLQSFVVSYHLLPLMM
jgi:hypothetical protein